MILAPVPVPSVHRFLLRRRGFNQRAVHAAVGKVFQRTRCFCHSTNSTFIHSPIIQEKRGKGPLEAVDSEVTV